jgi:hypothetical protein
MGRFSGRQCNPAKKGGARGAKCIGNKQAVPAFANQRRVHVIARRTGEAKKEFHMTYWRFGAMILTSTIVMFALMYINTFALEHLFWSETRVSIAILMGATMAVIMLSFMLSMYSSKSFAPNSKLRAQVTASQRGKNSPKLISKNDNQSDKPYHARSMSWLAGTVQRLKRVFNIDITECEKCAKHNVTVIACVTDALVIQKILTHLDKKHPILAQTSNLLPPMRAPPQHDFDWGSVEGA